MYLEALQVCEISSRLHVIYSHSVLHDNGVTGRLKHVLYSGWCKNLDRGQGSGFNAVLMHDIYFIPGELLKR